MKKRLLLLILLVSGIRNISAQEHKTYPAGGYRNLKELNAATPSAKEAFNIFKRSSEDMVVYGGNDYNIIFQNDSNSYKKIWRRYFAVANGDTLYLNCKKLDIGVGFTPVLVKGKYLAFKAYMPHNNTGANHEAAQNAMFGGAIGSLDDMPDKSKRQFPFLWSLNTETGRINMLTYGGMLHTLEPFPELTKAFMADEGKDQDEVILEYIRKANRQ